MYKVGDMVRVVAVQSMFQKHLIRRRLKECLRVTQGKFFKKRHASIAKHQLEIVEVIDHGEGRKGYVGYKPLNRYGTRFIVGHCNYPSYDENIEAGYDWLIYMVNLTHNEETKPIISHFEDVSLIDKWIQEGVYVNNFVKSLRYIFD